MNVFIIDNYDSFTYNLYQMIGEILNHEVKQGSISEFNITVKRNNEIDIDGIKAAKPDRIIVSPGPGTPTDEAYFGVCAAAITELGKSTPVLGVCLGMQGIAHVFGGTVQKAKIPMHGKTSPIIHNDSVMFKGVPQNLEIMRYHSLVVDADSMPDCLQITAAVAEVEEVEVMGIEHKEYPVYGIQFHPESFATEGGYDLIRNFLFCR